MVYPSTSTAKGVFYPVEPNQSEPGKLAAPFDVCVKKKAHDPVRNSKRPSVPLNPKRHPVSKSKMILMWVFFVGIPILIITLALSRHKEPPSAVSDTFNVGFFFVMVIIGGIFFTHWSG